MTDDIVRRTVTVEREAALQLVTVDGETIAVTNEMMRSWGFLTSIDLYKRFRHLASLSGVDDLDTVAILRYLVEYFHYEFDPDQGTFDDLFASVAETKASLEATTDDN